MQRWFIAALLAVSLSGTASARDLELLEGAHETELHYMTMPGSTAGTAIFRGCADCDPISRRVTARTVYMIGDRAFALPDFLQEVSDIREASPASAATPAAVYYDLATGRVTRIAVFFRSR